MNRQLLEILFELRFASWGAVFLMWVIGYGYLLSQRRPLLPNPELQALTRLVGALALLIGTGVIFTILSRWHIDSYHVWIVPTMAASNLAGLIVIAASLSAWRVFSRSLRLGELFRVATMSEEELINQNRILKGQVEDLERFSFLVAHDLNTPVTGAMGLAGMILTKYDTHLTPEVREFLEMLAGALNLLRGRIISLLELSRITTRGDTFRPVDTAALVDQIIAAFGNGGNPDVQITRDDLPQIVADPNQLGRVFSNLIDNAIKYNRSRPATVHVSAAVTDEAITFCVADNGIGFEPEFSQAIFEVFRRLDPDFEAGGDGTGLAHVKKIVERHRGEIWAESRPGEGSRFYFRLPRDLA